MTTTIYPAPGHLLLRAPFPGLVEVVDSAQGPYLRLSEATTLAVVRIPTARALAVRVRHGQSVAAGDVLAEFHSPR